MTLIRKAARATGLLTGLLILVSALAPLASALPPRTICVCRCNAYVCVCVCYGLQ